MNLEKTFNQFLGKELAKSSNAEADLDKRLQEIKERTLELNQAREHMAEGYGMVLQGLKKAFPDIDLDDPNFTDTPNRMARSLLEVCSGLGADDSEVFQTRFPSGEYSQVIMLKDIDFNSLCSHHFFPFTGRAHVGYLPNSDDAKVVGLSKLARIVDVHAQRPQLQERMAQDIKAAIERELNPSWVMVVLEAQHGCLNCRGAKKQNATMVTSAVGGKYKNDTNLRLEFLELIKR